MPFPRPQVDLHSPPPEFEAEVDWLERWSYGLVLLEEYPIPDLREAVAEVESSVRSHRATADPWVLPLLGGDEETARGARVVLSDHAWFETSLDQFWWFFRVVEREDHGGHRQALGQYGRVLAEALRRHLADEDRLRARNSTRGWDPVP